MIKINKHIATAIKRQRSFHKILFLLACTMCLFLSSTISAQVINNEGAVISVSTNTVVVSGVLQNTSNTIENDGSIELSSHFDNRDVTESDGVIRLAGNWTNTGTFNEGSGRVEFRGDNLQTLSSTEPGGETFYSLLINKASSSMSNLLDLNNNITITDSLNLNSGIIMTNAANTVWHDIVGGTAGSLIHNDNSTSRVIGKFERGVATDERYLFPVGSDENYNPLNLDPLEDPSPGSVLSEFIQNDPDTLGLPIFDDIVEIYSVIHDGYWSLNSKNGFSSDHFDMDMDGAGFDDSTTVQDISRILKRDSIPANSPWTVDGTHEAAVGTVGNRNNLTGNISSNGNHFAFGHPRPRIWTPPTDTTECDSTETYFSTYATGEGQLFYQWYVKPVLGGWTTISNGGIYSGADTDSLVISPVYLSMHGYRYRVKITHRHGHVKWSEIVTLNVDELPNAFINPARDTICSMGSTNFLITAHIPITEYRLANHSYGAVTGSDTVLTGPDQIIQTLVNMSYAVDSVRYTATPIGAGYARCVGHDGIAKVLVNPTPRILAQRTPDTLFCYGRTIDFDLSNIVSTTGAIHYDLDVYEDTVDFNGYWNPTPGLVPVEPGNDFSNTLINTHDSIKQISYRFLPYIDNPFGGTAKCVGGIADTLTIKMVPELTSEAIPDTTVLNPDMSIRVGGNPIRCFGESSGAVDLIATGGDYRSYYQFVWRDSITDDTLRDYLDNPDDRLENQPAGIYTYEIIDTIGCNIVGSFELTEPDELIGKDSAVAPLCAASYTGNIFMNVSGGITGYTYAWINLKTGWPTNPPGTHDLINQRSGKYEYTLTDTNLCVSIDTFKINKADELQAEVWDVPEPSKRYHLKCVNDSDGYLSVKTIEGTAKHPIEYTWYNESMEVINSGARDSTIENLSAGIYYAYIVDANGCTLPEEEGDTLLAYEIKEPDSIRFEKMNMPYASGWDISCFELADGALDIKYTGGNVDTLTNIFKWTGPGIDIGNENDSIHIDNSLIAGDYKVIIEDFLGCIDSTTFNLIEPDPFQIDLDTSLYIGGINIRCFGETNGSIYVNNVIGGGTTTEAGIYNYNWTPPGGFILPNGATSEDQDDLIAGTYELTITDQIGCDTSTTIELLEPAVLRSDTLIDRVGTTSDKNGYAIQCFGDNNGEISLIPVGGSRNYSYNWFDSTHVAAITADTLAQDLYKGVYSVIITDINGCDTSYRFVLNEPDTIILRPIIDPIYCFGGLATIHLDPEGGNDAYTYLWDDSSNEQNHESFPAGTYYVEVTDGNNCTVADSLTLVQNAQIIPTIAVTSNYNGREISCHDSDDGIIQVYVEPANREYDYVWSNGVIDSDFIENVDSGYYSVDIFDQFGCDTSISITVVSPPPLTVTIEALDPLCYGIPTGEITLFTEGGTPYPIPPAYSYTWNNPSFSGNQISELPQGDYSVSIVDVNDCQVDTAISLIEPDSLILEFETTLAECRDEANGSISISLIEGGTAPYITDIDGMQDNFFDYLIPGDYLIVLTDANGCIREDTAKVLPERESCLRLPNAFTPNGDGWNDTWILDEDEDGTTDMIYYPEAELRIYNRWGVLIYYTNNVASEPWDGTYNGRDMPIDSYHYILDLNNGDPPIIGNITIVR